MSAILYSKKTKQRLYLSTNKGVEHLNRLITKCKLRYEAFDFVPVI